LHYLTSCVVLIVSRYSRAWVEPPAAVSDQSQTSAAAEAAAAAAQRLMLWRPPVSTGHSFSPQSPVAAHSLLQRSDSRRYHPLPGMVSSRPSKSLTV